MKLRLRTRAGEGAEGSRFDRKRAVERRSPAGAVTSWLRQGLSSGMCPLCRVAHKADREWIWHFYDERSNDMTAIEEVRRAYGLCSEHVEMLRQIDVENMKSTLSISTTFADTFRGIVEDLDTLTPDAAFTPALCPACADRDDYVHNNAVFLLDMLATSPGHRDKFQASPGLCFGHFKLAWGLAPTREDRELLLAVQRKAARSLLCELTEHVRKHDDKYRHEPKGPERDSWLRAIFLTAGWPPPARSAAQPEQPR